MNKKERIYAEYLINKFDIVSHDGEPIELNVLLEECKKYKDDKGDSKFITMTLDILQKFNVRDLVDDKRQQQNSTEAERIFMMYKQYADKSLNKNIAVNYLLDTSETFYVETLDCSTAVLMELFGDFIQSGDVNTKHRYEYKLVYKDHIFSIYDYMYDDDTFELSLDAITWYLASESEDIVNDFLDTFTNLTKKLKNKGGKCKIERSSSNCIKKDACCK